MQNFNSNSMLRADWDLSKQTVIDYHHQSTHSSSSSPFPSSYSTALNYPPFSFNANGVQPDLVPPPSTDNLVANFQQKIQPFNTNNLPESYQHLASHECGKVNPNDHLTVHESISYHGTITEDVSYVPKKYDPFVEDKLADMDISDDEKPSKNKAISAKQRLHKSPPMHESMEVNSGAAFYEGLILYIPPFEQIANTFRGSPAMKMLYASFEFSFKEPIRIETKPRENSANMNDATVYFRDHILSCGSGVAPHVEASVRALEILSETCYTIQAKEDYFLKCKLVDAETMKTLNLKRWEAVCQKYPKLIEITKESHFQKTFALFLDSHTSTGIFEDIVCCNLTRQDVNNIKSVVGFFHLTMLPCAVSTNLSKKHTPCVVSIHKYTSSQKLLDILIESGGENEKFRVYPPDTFKEFYKLHQSFWDPVQKKNEKYNQSELKTVLEDEDLQALILKPYENTVSELFEKFKTLPKVKPLGESGLLRKAGDDFMKETLQIDMANSKNVAPVERMQLLLKYMEQLQEYGSRVLTAGRPQMIKIYHNAIDNLRKDLDTCRKDIENDQKDKTLSNAAFKPETRGVNQTPQKRTSPRRRSKSPAKKNRRGSTKRSSSPKRSFRSLSPRRRQRSKSPRKRPLRTPPRKARSPVRKYSPLPKQDKQSHSSQSIEGNVLSSIFADRLKKYMENLRRFRIEIEDTPLERRSTLKDQFACLKEQLYKFHLEVSGNPRELSSYVDEIEICKDELREQTKMIANELSFSEFSCNNTPPPWMNIRSFEPENMPVSYPLPGLQLDYGSLMPPPSGLNRQETPLGFSLPY